MTKVDFTNWLHSELNAVFHGDITPEQVMLNAIPMIDAIFSQNSGKPHVSGALLSDVDYWKQRCLLAEQCLEQSPCDPDITSEQIKALNAYHKFISWAGNDRYVSGLAAVAKR